VSLVVKPPTGRENGEGADDSVSLPLASHGIADSNGLSGNGWLFVGGWFTGMKYQRFQVLLRGFQGSSPWTTANRALTAQGQNDRTLLGAIPRNH
jgi:hypothetical protein